MGVKWYLGDLKCLLSCLLTKWDIFSCVYGAGLCLIQGLWGSFLGLESQDGSVGFVRK